MTQGEPITLLGRCNTLANGDGYYERYNGKQAVSESTNTRKNTATRNPSAHHLHLECHTIFHPGKQTEAEWGNGCPSEG